jgi:hypothetical protein
MPIIDRTALLDHLQSRAQGALFALNRDDREEFIRLLTVMRHIIDTLQTVDGLIPYERRPEDKF